MGGGYTGALVLLCLAFLMPYCAFIPKVGNVIVIKIVVMVNIMVIIMFTALYL